MDLSKFTSNKKFLMLALDHRESFKKLINPQAPEAVLDDQVISLKHKIIESLQDQFSGLLIDETFGLKAYPDHQKSFLLPVEKTGYDNVEGERLTKLEYSVDQLIELGASGAKLLLYFNPYLNSYKQQLETAKTVIDQCNQKDFPIFLEIVTYEVDRELSLVERPKYVLDSLKIFLNTNVIPSVFKLEYPGDSETCQKITQLLDKTPWILLTRGITYDQFTPQLKVASINGCQGFLAGRALWQEACTMHPQELEKFLQETLPERFKILSQIFSS